MNKKSLEERACSRDKRFHFLAQTFQALGDASRVQIVWLLSQGEHNVGDMARLMSMTQPAVSHHLRTLRNLKLVKIRKEGRTSFYQLDDHHINRLLREGLKHVEEFL
jgi:ArsR family transcriptional regulator, lead/cadmium/zinc/bismuth-responsive transcriptional repressor